MEDKLRQRDAMTEKLRLKNATLKGQLQKVHKPPCARHNVGRLLDCDGLKIVQKPEQRFIFSANM